MKDDAGDEVRLCMEQEEKGNKDGRQGTRYEAGEKQGRLGSGKT